jgi:hypothetical protein
MKYITRYEDRSNCRELSSGRWPEGEVEHREKTCLHPEQVQNEAG